MLSKILIKLLFLEVRP